MDKLVFYGTRGSSSLTSNKYMEFGGATTCILFNFNNTHIMVDCGSGINNAIDDLNRIDELHLLISHSHLDHIGGITTLFSSFDNKVLHVWGKTHNGVTVRDSIEKIMNQSLWPVRADTYKNVVFHDIDGDVMINDVKVENMDSNHPGGCSLFKLTYENESYVTAFDFSHLDGFDEKLIEFAKDATTLIYDGCLSENEIEEKADWGHSTPKQGALIGKKASVKNVIITHFGVYDDKTLSAWETEIKKDYPNVSFARSGYPKDDLKKMVEIGAMLSAEKDNDVLLTKIVETSMEITNADGGTLYLLEDSNLTFKVLINKSKSTKFVKKDAPSIMPSVKITGKNACAASARLKKLINIPDCYKEKEYDFSGSKEYDRFNDYFTQSVLVIPLIDEYDDVIGVLQLINAKDANGDTCEFNKQDEDILMAIANQASMAIVNSAYSQKINDLLYGFVKVMSVEIDERTPYNANHTRNMVRFAENFFDYEEKSSGKYNVDSKKRREILMSIWLHDIGKILTPIDIMNKDSRLGELTKEVAARFERRFLLLKLALANKEITEEEYKELEQERVNQHYFITKLNNVGFLSDDLKNELDRLALQTYKELDGTNAPVITKDEHYQLSIVKGTLNKEERKIMEDHVSMTQKFLSQLNFPKYYDSIPTYAGNHHEFLNGTGYPNHLTEKDLPWPCRLITICDIFEALTAKDRPYKKPMSIEKSFEILYEMADFGKLDKEIISEFEKSNAWE